jgi:hypothetical protein
VLNGELKNRLKHFRIEEAMKVLIIPITENTILKKPKRK